MYRRSTGLVAVIYVGSNFAGIVFHDRLYLKTDDSTRSWFQDRGMTPFKPNKRQTLKNYYEVPPDAIESPQELADLFIDAAGIEAR